MNGRNYHFLGALSDFTNDGAIQLWRLDMQGEDADAGSYQSHVIMARLPCTRRLKDQGCPVYQHGNIQAIEYTDEFVNENMQVYSDHSSFGQTTNYTLTSSPR